MPGFFNTRFLAYLVDRWNAVRLGYDLTQPYLAASADQGKQILLSIGKIDETTGNIHLEPILSKEDGYAFFSPGTTTLSHSNVTATLCEVRRPEVRGCARVDVKQKDGCTHVCPFHPNESRRPREGDTETWRCGLKGVPMWHYRGYREAFVRVDIPVADFAHDLHVRTGAGLLQALLDAMFPGLTRELQLQGFQATFAWTNAEFEALFGRR